MTASEPDRGHEGMDIGLEYFPEPSEDRLLAMLTQPAAAAQGAKQAPVDPSSEWDFRQSSFARNGRCIIEMGV